MFKSVAIAVLCTVLAVPAVASTVGYKATSAQNPNSARDLHSLWLGGLGYGGISGLTGSFDFNPAGKFQVTETAGDVTATLNGTTYSRDAGWTTSGFDLAFSYDDDLSAYGGNPGFKGNATLQAAQTLAGDVKFLNLTMGTLTGFGKLLGINFDVQTYPTPAAGRPATQYGTAANDKTTNFGLSGWFTLTFDQNACSNAHINLCSMGNRGDVNLELAQAPLPASSLLLLAGIGGMAAVARAKRKSA